MPQSRNLNEFYPRQGTGSAKWETIPGDNGELIVGDHAHPSRGDQQLLPMWVADMDFRVPEPVIEAMKKRVEHGIFGYTIIGDEYYQAVIDWIGRRTDWQIKKEWIVDASGIVPALYLIVRTFTDPGDKILIQRPVYHPFTNAIVENDREPVSNSLIFKDGHYEMDFDDLARKTADPKVKLALLCSPHNPGGRVWTREELQRFGEICLQNNVMVVADEIHCDLIFSDYQFVSYGSVCESFYQNSIFCRAASKTFNLAGLKTSTLIIPNDSIRDRFNKEKTKLGLKGPNLMGLVATQAAYEHGEPWLNDVMAYIEDNYLFLKSFLAEHVPLLKPIDPQGSYLIWIDCRALELSSEERKKLFFEKAKLYLISGEIFGPEGEGFERINLACPRQTVEKALHRIKRVVDQIALLTPAKM